MALYHLVQATVASLSRQKKEEGLHLLTRLGRYAHENEREVAFLLPGLRAGELCLAQIEEYIQEESRSNLRRLLAKNWLCRVNAICQAGDISAARIIYCELMTICGKEATHQSEENQALNCLRRWLPSEACEGLLMAELCEDDVKAVFSKRRPQQASA